MAKPIDLTKYRKDLTKAIPGISAGFNDPETFIDTGNFLLNYLISGDFKKGIPFEGKMTIFAGESGSAKSYIVSGNTIRNAQKQGMFVVLIDTENALDEEWLQRLGVDTSEDKLLKINASVVDDVAKLLCDFVDGYRKDYEDVPKSERPPVSRLS